MSSGATAEDKTWQAKERGHEEQYIREKEKAQYAVLRAQLEEETRKTEQSETKQTEKEEKREARDFERGFGGQEDLEDRYATTSGEH